MNEKEILTEKFILVGMDDAKISTVDKPIIGTQALATCIGVLLYSEEKKVAIVAHVSAESIYAVDKIFRIIIDNKLTSTKFKYKIIPGYYKDHYGVIGKLEKYFSHFIPFEESKMPNDAINTVEEFTSREFAFDASTGKFVTDKVYFGLQYNAINKVGNIKK